MPIPRYFQSDFDKQRVRRNYIIDQLLEQFHDIVMPEEEIIEERSTIDAKLDTVIRIIQKNERGRQGIERALIAKLLRKNELKRAEKQRKLQEGIEVAEETEREDAVLVL